MRLVTNRQTRLYAMILGWVIVTAGGWTIPKHLVGEETPKAQLSSDWPAFRNGFDLQGVAGSPLPDKLELLWKHPAGEMVVGSPAISQGRVYIGSLKGEMLCLDLQTGKPVWTYRTITDTDPNSFAPGFKCAPTLTDKLVLAGDEDGVFHAIDRKTGKQVWQYKTFGEIVSSASLYQDKYVLFGSHDNSLYCLKLNGTLSWKFETQGPVNCTPAIIGNRTFVTGCDEHLRVINIDTGKQETDFPLGTYLIASPAVVGTRLYVGTYASEVVAVDWKDSRLAWTYKAADREFPYHSSAAVNDQYVVVGGQDKRVHCLDRATGKKVWLFETRAKVDSSPVIVGQRVFVGSRDGNIYGIDLKTGKEVWRHNDPRGFSGSPAVGEGRLVIGSEANDGFIYCFGAKDQP